MLNVMYNFTNAIDEEMTQQDLLKSSAGQDFISRWTWKNQEHISNSKYPRFRKSNTVEDYFYVRIIEDDSLLAIGGIRLHWNKEGTLILDSTLQIVECCQRYHWREDPHQRYDLEHIIKTKLYKYLSRKMNTNRYCDDYDHDHYRPIPTPPPHQRPCPPPPPKHDCCWDNPPIHGPYGGESGVVYDLIEHHREHHDCFDHKPRF